MLIVGADGQWIKPFDELYWHTFVWNGGLDQLQNLKENILIFESFKQIMSDIIFLCLVSISYTKSYSF